MFFWDTLYIQKIFTLQATLIVINILQLWKWYRCTIELLNILILQWDFPPFLVVKLSILILLLFPNLETLEFSIVHGLLNLILSSLLHLIHYVSGRKHSTTISETELFEWINGINPGIIPRPVSFYLSLLSEEG